MASLYGHFPFRKFGEKRLQALAYFGVGQKLFQTG